MVYFTSDLHLGHQSIIRMQNRPFENVDEMDRTIIQNINSVVTNNDRLYILGDIAHHIPREMREELISKIRGKKYLLLGNHDLTQNGDWTDLNPKLFEWIGHYRKESLYGLNIIMMHYPLMSWHKINAGSIMLHGHIHAGPEYNQENIQNGIRRYDVGMDANQYMPVSVYQIQEWAKNTDIYNGVLKNYISGSSAVAQQKNTDAE